MKGLGIEAARRQAIELLRLTEERLKFERLERDILGSGEGSEADRIAALEADNAALRQRLADVMPLADFGLDCVETARWDERARELGLLERCDYKPAGHGETDLARRARDAARDE